MYLLQENHEYSPLSSGQRAMSNCKRTQENEPTTSLKRLHQNSTAAPLWWPWLPTSRPIKRYTVNEPTEEEEDYFFTEIPCFGHGEVESCLVELWDNFQSHWGLWMEGEVAARLSPPPSKVHRCNSKAPQLCHGVGKLVVLQENNCEQGQAFGTTWWSPGGLIYQVPKWNILTGQCPSSLTLTSLWLAGLGGSGLHQGLDRERP